MTPLPYRWNHAGQAPEILVGLSMDGTTLTLEAEVRAPDSPAPETFPGGFEADLWKADVVELFLALPDQPNAYLEFNFAPDGRWWGAEFENLRKLRSELPGSTCRVAAHALPAGDGWRVQAAILLGFAPEQGNLCGILGQEPRRFASLADIPTPRPDFHQPEHFVALPIQ